MTAFDPSNIHRRQVLSQFPKDWDLRFREVW
jgi:hypothetical protein